MLKKIFSNTIVRLLLAVIIGLLVGLVVNEPLLKAIMVVKQLSGQVIIFLVPLIILGFVAPSIARLKSNASKMLLFAFAIAYLSSVGAASFGAIVGYHLIPSLHIETATEGLREAPAMLFNIEIPPVMSVMSALVLAIFVGLSTAWVRSEQMEQLLDTFQQMILRLVERILMPLLPLFIAANFCVLSYEGALTRQLPIFLSVLVVVILCHYLWLMLLYGLASFYSRKNGWQVLRNYGPAYLTALGTMSSAATLGTALKCAGRSSLLRKEVIDVTIPLFANIHLCGSILTETFFVMTVSQVLYGCLPDPTTMAVFITLLGLFAIGAPGVPGGTVLASLGLIIAILGFDEAGTALLLTIFALQDSFGTACNVTGDGALTLIVDTFERRQQPTNPIT